MEMEEHAACRATWLRLPWHPSGAPSANPDVGNPFGSLISRRVLAPASGAATTHFPALTASEWAFKIIRLNSFQTALPYVPSQSWILLSRCPGSSSSAHWDSNRTACHGAPQEVADERRNANPETN